MYGQVDHFEANGSSLLKVGKCIERSINVSVVGT
jgi:hypothetical protein